MKLFANARLEVGYFDARSARHAVPAVVAFDGGGMTLAVEGGRRRVLYHGERNGQGHYLLRAAETDAEATLHRFAGSQVLEGFWRVGRERGFWRLHLLLDAPLEQRLPSPRAPVVAPFRPRRVKKRLRLAA